MGYNMFAYCNNNPVMYVDVTGMVSCTSFDVSTPWHVMAGKYVAHGGGGFGGSSFGGGIQPGGGLGGVDRGDYDYDEGITALCYFFTKVIPI